jgi:tRNA threonylcarbamoyladenosine biosynthesis protein TsaE
MEWTLQLADADATLALGARLGETAHDGAVLALIGELGAGKTTLAQGVGQGLRVTDLVTSPTFQIMSLHAGRLQLIHVDLYRLGDGSELQELGLDDWVGVSGVALVEWADRFPDELPSDRLELRLSYVGDHRSATLSAHGPNSTGWLERARA